MPFRRLLPTIAVLLALGCLPSTALADAAGSAFVKEVNVVRADHGLGKVKASTNLGKSSSRYARWMLRRNYFGHLARIRMNRRFSRRGEVLARTRREAPTPQAVVEAWLASRAHRAVLLNPRYRYAGVGLARGAGARPTTLLVGHFGAR